MKELVQIAVCTCLGSKNREGSFILYSGAKAILSRVWAKEPFHFRGFTLQGFWVAYSKVCLVMGSTNINV